MKSDLTENGQCCAYCIEGGEMQIYTCKGKNCRCHSKTPRKCANCKCPVNEHQVCDHCQGVCDCHQTPSTAEGEWEKEWEREWAHYCQRAEIPALHRVSIEDVVRRFIRNLLASERLQAKKEERQRILEAHAHSGLIIRDMQKASEDSLILHFTTRLPDVIEFIDSEKFRSLTTQEGESNEGV